MADVRDMIVAGGQRKPGKWTLRVGRVLQKLTMTARHAVVATSAAPPLHSLYTAIYGLHVRYAVRVLRRFPQVKAVYLARGAAAGDLMPGVSDIDLLVLGEWTDAEQKPLMEAVQRLIKRSPLYDSTIATSVNTMETVRALHAGDYFFQFRFDRARRSSKLVHGSDLLASLPDISADRARGGFYVETKLWWMFYMTAAFGSGITSSDRIFRNSIAFKTVAEVLNMEGALSGHAVESSRAGLVERAKANADEAEQRILARFLESWKRRFLKYEGDVFNDSFWLVLRRLESIHASLASAAPFRPTGASILLDAPFEEMIQTEASRTFIAELLSHVKKEWPGYRSAYVCPRNCFAGVDDLQVLIDVDPHNPPTADQIRAACRLQPTAGSLQRVAVYLLLANGAYLLERKAPLEFWHVLLAPAANPDVFVLLGREEFLVYGPPRPATAEPVWTHFSETLIGDELRLRRSAMAKAMAGTGDMPSNPLQLLRGIWRQLQLEVIERSIASGTVKIPLTVAAIRRGVLAWGIPDLPIFNALAAAYRDELEGRPSDAATLIPQAIALFQGFAKVRGG